LPLFCKPDFVHPTYVELCDHLSHPCGVPFRMRLLPGDSNRMGSPSPVMSCITWGLPSLLCHLRSGGLLPHLFTLTRPKPGGIFLRHFPSCWLKPAVPPFQKARYPMMSGLSSTPCCQRTAITRRADQRYSRVLLQLQDLLTYRSSLWHWTEPKYAVSIPSNGRN